MKLTCPTGKFTLMELLTAMSAVGIVTSLLVVVRLAIGGFCWWYALNFWLEYLHKTQHVMWWQGVLLAIIPLLHRGGVVLAIGTWICSLFFI